MDQLFQNFRSGGTGSDTASLDLGTQLFILNQLPRVFHCKDHGSGIVALRRRSLSFLHIQRTNRQDCPLFQILHHLEKLWIHTLFSCILRNSRYFQIPFFCQNLKIREKALLPYLYSHRYFLIYSGRIKNTQKPFYNTVIHIPCRLGDRRKCRKSLSGRNDRIMIGNLFIIDITGLYQVLIRSHSRDFF